MMILFEYPNEIKIVFFQFLSNFLQNEIKIENSFFDQNFKKIVENVINLIFE